MNRIKKCLIKFILNEAPPIGAQSGSRIYQSQNFLTPLGDGGGTGGGRGEGIQLLMLSPKMLKSKIHIFTGGWAGWGRGWQPTFDAESKNAKIQNSYFHKWVGEGGGWGWWPMFDAESKNAKIQNSHFHRWVSGWWGLAANF